MYITEFFRRLEVVPVADAFEWEVCCDRSSMAGYAESVIANLRNGEPGPTWSDGLFSVLTNFAVHVLSYENCGLVVGASDAEQRAIRLGNFEKDIQFDTPIGPKKAVTDRLIDELKSILRRRRPLEKRPKLVAVHDIAVDAAPLEQLSRSKVDALDFILIFDGRKDVVEGKLHNLRRRPEFISTNFHLREFSFKDEAPWALVVYAHEPATDLKAESSLG